MRSFITVAARAKTTLPAMIGDVGRMLIGAGLVLVVLGLLFLAGERLPIRFGHLPGDIELKGRHGTFYFPLVTCLLLSALLSFVMWLIGRWR